MNEERKIASFYRRVGEKQYLVFTGSACEVGKTYQMAMAVTNPMEGILPADYEYLDDQIRENIDITNLTPLTELAGKLRKEHAEITYRRILQAMEQTEEFLLSAEHLLIDPHYLYWNTESESLGICFVPFYECTVKNGLEILTDWFLAGMAKEDQAGILLLCRIRHALDSPQLHGNEIREILYGAEEDRENVRSRFGYETDGFAEYGDSGEETCTRREKQEAAQKIKEQGTEYVKSRIPEKNVRMVVLCGLLVSACVYLLLHSDRLDPFYRILFLSILGISFAVLLIYGFLRRRSHVRQETGTQDPYAPLSDLFDPYETEEISYLSDYDDAGRVSGEHEVLNNRRNSVPDTTMELPGISDFLRAHQTPADPHAEDKSRNRNGNPAGLSITDSSGEEGDCLIAADANVQGPQRILLQGKRMLIGKHPAYADVVLESSAVSRLHACLLQKDGEWYVRDLLSGNGTFADGSILESEEVLPLASVTELAFADCRYLVNLKKTNTEFAETT